MTGSRLSLVGSNAPPPADDGELVGALLRREAGAPARAFARWLPTVRSTLRRHLGPEADVDDLAQDVFHVFFRKVEALRDAGAVHAFLVSICLRVARQEVRRRRRWRWLGLTSTGALPEVAGPEPDWDRRELLVRYYRLLDRLGAEARTIFVLRHLEGAELARVAQLAGVSQSTAQRRLAWAAKRLAAWVADDPALSEYAAAARGGDPLDG